MTVIPPTLLLILAAGYAAVILWLVRGLTRLRPGTASDEPSVSVVVAARNEEAVITRCLDALTSQNYPLEKTEIIVVDDRSTDATGGIIDAYTQRNARIRRVNVTDTASDIAPKKRALTLGIAASTGGIILTTDADCTPQPGWIRALVRHFEPDVGLVAGYSPLDSSTSPTLPGHLAELDGLALAGVAAGSFGAGLPLTCTGRNLAYRKHLFDEVGGFTSIERFVSGDDDLFLHKVQSGTGWKMRYAIEPEASVPTNPPRTLMDFVHQRTRHASKGFHYPVWLTVGLVAVYIFNLLLLAGLCIPAMRTATLAAWGLKIAAEALLVFRAASVLHHRHPLRIFPLAAILHPVYVAVFGFVGQIGRFRWKESAYQARISRSDGKGAAL